MANNNNDGKSKFALGAIIGTLIGVIAGFLTAPKSGKETRQDIKEGATRVFSEAEKELKKLHLELGELLEKGRVEAVKKTDKVKVEIDKAIDAAQKAQNKAKEVISAIHSGETTNAELKKAIEDITKAKEHLKKYIKSS